MSVPFVYSNGTFNLMLGGKCVQVSPEHPSYGLVKKSLATATEAELLKLVDVNSSMETYVSAESKGRATVSNGQVYYDGKPIHNTLSERILTFMKEGLPFKHLLLFMENVSKNPSYNSQQELFDFLQHRNLPITEDGQFLAYKAVRNDWMDKYSGKIDNSIGQKPSVNRCEVDDNRNRQCSKGLHVGALDYVYQYGSGDDHIIIVKVNPADAVSVPDDHNFMKLRTCRYEVVGEFKGELKSPLYNSAGDEEVKGPCNNENYDWSWADDESDDNYNDEDECDYCGYPMDDCCCDEDDDYQDEYDEDEDYPDYDDGEEEDCDDLGVKPNGARFHNKRDSSGRFSR